MYACMNILFIHICTYLRICAYVYTYVDLSIQYVCMFVRMYECNSGCSLEHDFKLSSMSRKYSIIATYIDTSIALFRPLKLH
jgi:hypothetical protein